MNCYLHPDTPATAFCRACGRPLCALCMRTVDGTVYCLDHVPAPAYAGGSAAGADPNVAGAPNPYFQATPPVAGPRVQNSPGLAFVLGFIPGVGAIYNGQYIKGLVHAIILGLLISLLDATDNTAGQPLLAMLLAVFVFYMAFEAYHTAKKRQLGLPLEEWSSLVARPAGPGSRAPVGPILLIAIGVLFLLDTLNLIHFREIGRFWPVLLILLGAYMLWSRVTTTPGAPNGRPYRSATDTSANTAMGTRHD